MKRQLFAMVIIGSILAFGQAARAQSEATGAASGSVKQNSSRAAAGSSLAAVRSGTMVAAELQSSVDAKTAKPGDEVVARVTKNVKQDGRVVIHKGDRLIGHVKNVQTAANGKGGSAVGIAFDQLQSGGATTQLNTVVNSLLSVRGQGRSSSDGDLLDSAPMMAPGPAPALSGRGGGGGLLGGVTGGVGSAVGSTAGAVGGVGSTVGGTVSGAANSSLGGLAHAGIATPLKSVQVNSVAQGQAQGASTSQLSTRRGTLHLDSGTQMQLRVAAQGSAEAK